MNRNKTYEAIISGNIVATQNFDAWGRYRNPTDWTYNNVPAQPTWLYRGYTGHESMAVGGLINMNGRVYDPVVGRMLSPDNNITYPNNTQGYNRYAYGLNNPLMFIDPTGNNFGSVMADIGAFIGLAGVGYIGASLISNGHVFSNVSSWQSNWWKGALAADLIAASVAVPILSPATAVVTGSATITEAGMDFMIPVTTTVTGSAAFAATTGMSAGLASVISGAATGVLTAASSTILSTIAAHQPFDAESFMDQMFTSEVGGALSGAANAGMGAGIKSLGLSKFANSTIGKIIYGGIKSTVNGIITDEVKDVDASGHSGWWEKSTGWDMVTNFARSTLSLTNFVNFAPGKAGYPYPFSQSKYNYMRELYPNIVKSIASTTWSGMTTIKAVNGRFEYTPSASGFDFNSLLKTVPPLFYTPYFSGGQGRGGHAPIP